MPDRTRIPALVLVLLTLLLGASPHVPAQELIDEPRAPRPTSYVLLQMGSKGDELLGVHLTDDGVRRALQMVTPKEAPDLVILRFNCYGGMLREVPELIDLITQEVAPETRVVAWIDVAVSAAALVAMGCPEIAMSRGGTVGAAVTYKREGGERVALVGEELERALEVGAEIARRTGRDPRIVRAMQTPTPLSYDVDPNGAIRLRSDTDGHTLLCDDQGVLTLNAKDAHAVGLSIGTADSLDDLLTLLGVENPRDVGRFASESMHRHVIRASAAIDRIAAYDRTVRRSIRSAEEADTDEQRIEALQQAEKTLVMLKREASRQPDVAAYLRIDDIRLELYQLDIAELHAPVGAGD